MHMSTYKFINVKQRFLHCISDQLAEDIQKPEVVEYLARLTDPQWRVDKSKKRRESLKQSFRRLSVF